MLRIADSVEELELLRTVFEEADTDGRSSVEGVVAFLLPGFGLSFAPLTGSDSEGKQVQRQRKAQQASGPCMACQHGPEKSST